VWVDTADLDEIEEWRQHPWVSGFTTNPTLMRNAWTPDEFTAMDWAHEVVGAAKGYPISIDGPPEVWELGPNVIRKMASPPIRLMSDNNRQINWTAICDVAQVKKIDWVIPRLDIISVFVGRILDTGRDPQPVIDAAKQTGAQVLWASVREPYHMVMAEQAGCDIITVPPAILTKWLDWHGKPLEQVAAETIRQFDKDREGLW
jgi:transaldolase